MFRRGKLMLPSTTEGRVLFYGYIAMQVLVFAAAATVLARHAGAWERVAPYAMVASMPLSMPLVHAAEGLGLLDTGRAHLWFLLLVAVADVLLLRWIICWYECVLMDKPTGAPQ
jgi:hypothetical protein